MKVSNGRRVMLLALEHALVWCLAEDCEGENAVALPLGADVLVAVLLVAVLHPQPQDVVRQPLHLSPHLHTNIFTKSK